MSHILKIAGKSYRCECGCNVFTKLHDHEHNYRLEAGETVFRCNSCRTDVAGLGILGCEGPVKIASFSGDYDFLSNFAWSPFTTPGGRHVKSVEHGFQAAKTLDKAQQDAILAAASPGEAKRLGRRATMRPNWATMRIQAMRELLRLKFSVGSPFATMLLNTGDAELIEGNTWGDKFWGVCGGEGENNLGRLLMERRAEIKAAIRACGHGVVGDCGDCDHGKPGL